MVLFGPFDGIVVLHAIYWETVATLSRYLSAANGVVVTVVQLVAARDVPGRLEEAMWQLSGVIQCHFFARDIAGKNLEGVRVTQL